MKLDKKVKQARRLKGVGAVALGFALALTATLPSASAAGLSGGLDGNTGNITYYGTYRYKPASSATYLTVTSWSPRYNGAVYCGAYIRLGLRNQAGTQVTPSYQWDSPGAEKRFTTTSGANLSAYVSYAINGRTNRTGSTDLCGTVTWNGSLAL